MIAASILAGSVIRGEPETVGIPDGLLHLLAYGALAAATAVAIRERFRHAGILLLAVAALAAVYGFLVELLQEVLPHRSFQWSDVGANVAGAVLGSFVASVWTLLSTRR